MDWIVVVTGLVALFTLIYIFPRVFVTGPSIRTASFEVSKKPDNHKTTYRVTQIPSSYDESSLAKALQTTLNISAPSEVKIYSLAIDTSQHKSWSTATVSFSATPPLLALNKRNGDLDTDLTINGHGTDDIVHVDSHFLGFTPLSPAANDEEHVIDCIAIHGWGGHAFGSFRTGSDYMWIRDALAKDEPVYRVWTYGYDSSLKSDDSHSDQYEYAETFRRMLRIMREGRSPSYTSPIVFIVHSLGGLVLKEAYINIKRNGRDADQEILQSTYGALFFGVPNNGMDVESLRAMIGDKPQQYTSYLLDRTIGSRLRNRQHEEFCQAFHFKDSKIIQCFETRTTPSLQLDEITQTWKSIGKGKLLVDASSATCGRNWETTDEFKISIDADHRGMVKFPRYDRRNYPKVHEVLRDFSEAAVPTIEKRFGQDQGLYIMNGECALKDQDLHAIHRGVKSSKSPSSSFDSTYLPAYLDTLAFPQMNYRREEVIDAHADSCTWILQHSSYQQWLADDHGLLWIQGKPGSGKSTLMKRIFKDICSENRDPGQIHLSFFFHRRGVELQHTPLGMLRTMLHQLLSQVPSASVDFQSLCEEKSRFQGDDNKVWEWREAELCRVLQSSLISAAKDHSIMIFVDALDEAGEDAARSVVSYLHKLNETLLKLSSKQTSRICFSCRHYPIVRTSEGIQICVEDENFNDIAAYVLSEFGRQILPRNEDATLDRTYELKNQISKKASGVFLWVSLVVPLIAKQYNEGWSYDEILEELEKVPTDLHAIYKQNLELVNPARQRETLHLMEWICFADRPLSLTELRFALAMDDSSVHLDLVDQEFARESKGFIESDARMMALVIGLSGGLAEVKTHERESEMRDDYGKIYQIQNVQFIHQSVNDFLLKDGFVGLDHNYAGKALGRGHDRLAKSCINYLKLGEFESVANSILTKIKPSRIEADHPFIGYSTRSWFLHAEKAESWNIPQTDLILRLQWPSAQYFSNWIKIFKAIHPDTLDSYQVQKQTTLMHMAASSNLESIVIALLEAGTTLEVKNVMGCTALHNAAHSGHVKTVHRLLNAGADANAKTYKQKTPLVYAGAGGHAQVVKLLLKTGAEVNQDTGDSGNALQSAAESGHWIIVKLLLDQGANINAQGGYYGNALQAASSRGPEAVVKLLLDRGANINAQGGYFGNALQAAASRGLEAVVKLLLDRGANINAQGGHYGNALQVAAFRGLEAVVKLLLDRGANINAQGEHYGNALQAAASRGSKVVVKLLLDRGADINHKDPQGRLAVHFALMMGGSTMVKYLLSLGATLDRTYTDQQGLSALHFAASGGSLEDVKLVLSSDNHMNIDLPDTQGWTPLHWACRRGRTDVIQLLVDSGANLLDKNKKSWTPLDVATFCGKNDAIFTLTRLLQSSTTTEMTRNILAPGLRHVGILCRSCFQEVFGTCYQCKDCASGYYELCFRCIEDAATIHDVNHNFEVVGTKDVDSF